MSARSRKRRKVRRAAERRRAERTKATMELIARTRMAFVAPDVWEAMKAAAERGEPGPIGELAGGGIEVFVEPNLAPGTIAGFDFDAFAPLRTFDDLFGPLWPRLGLVFPHKPERVRRGFGLLGPLPTPSDFDRLLWGGSR